MQSVKCYIESVQDGVAENVWINTITKKSFDLVQILNIPLKILLLSHTSPQYYQHSYQFSVWYFSYIYRLKG